MRVSVDLSAELVRRLDSLARRLRRSRRELVGAAVAQYVERHDPGVVTSALNRLAAQLDTRLDMATSGATRRMLQRSDW